MTCFTHIEYGSTGLAVKDVQARLASLGFDLADEATQGFFGSLTAQAVSAFRQRVNLPEGGDVDLETWTALVDETFMFGDRLLYLRLPHFHGRDVATLQTALGVLGFSCIADGIFGAHTEQAVRDFQQNAGISSDGIVGHSTFSAINRLRHSWEGKSSLCYEATALGFARAAEVLERISICIFGADELACRIAERISNLAMATTSSSRVTCVSSPEQISDNSKLTIILTSKGGKAKEQDSVPLVLYDNDATIGARMATALTLPATGQRRIVVHVAYSFDTDDADRASRREQHAAIALLDALCLSFS